MQGEIQLGYDFCHAIEKGRREGHAQEENGLSTLINLLLKKGLTNDIPKVTTDSSYRDALYEKYQL